MAHPPYQVICMNQRSGKRSLLTVGPLKFSAAEELEKPLDTGIPKSPAMVSGPFLIGIWNMKEIHLLPEPLIILIQKIRQAAGQIQGGKPGTGIDRPAVNIIRSS